MSILSKEQLAEFNARLDAGGASAFKSIDICELLIAVRDAMAEADEWQKGARDWQRDYNAAVGELLFERSREAQEAGRWYDSYERAAKWAARWKGYARRERIARQSLVQAQEVTCSLLERAQRELAEAKEARSD